MSWRKMGKVKWTAVVLTCANNYKDWTHTLQSELEARQAKGQIDKDVILLTVEDPKTDVGSGGATVNALLTVVEHISARQGFTSVNEDVLKGVNILILHNGTAYSYDACGRPFTTLPAKFSSSRADGLVCNIDLLLKLITENVAAGSPAGVWVSSLDMMLSVPPDANLSWKACDACLVTMPASVDYAKDHGVCRLDSLGMVQDILYQQPIDALQACQRPDGTVPVVCGIVYLSMAVSEKLLSFYTKPPLDACTYFGLDSGQPPMKLSLFFDVLLPMTTAVSEQDFVQGERSSTYGRPRSGDGDSKDSMTIARKLLWKELHGYRLRAYMIEGGKVQYLVDQACEYQKILFHPLKSLNDGLTWSQTVQADVKPQVQLGKGVVLINSRLRMDITVGDESSVCHCCLSGNIAIGKDSLFSGLSIENLKPKKKMTFAESIVMQGYNIYIKSLATTRNVLTVHGRFDNIKSPAWKTNATFCNEPWLAFLKRTGIVKEDLWGTDVGSDQQTVYSAQMFPVFHATETVGLKEVLWLQGQISDTPSKDILKRWRFSWRLSLAELLYFVDLKAELSWRKTLFYKVAELELEQALTMSLNQGFTNLYLSAAVDGFSQQLMQMLDAVASKTTDPGIAARTLANIADIMGCMAGTIGGLRSGPAANQSWRKAFTYLENKDFVQGVAALAKERSHWLDRPDHLIRAARHYEGAAQILIRHAVMTAKQFFTVGEGTLPPMGQWVQADCPARIDLSGGWSDTPPITYEHGGAVTMIGVLVNGKRPIGCRVRRINEPLIRLELMGNGEVSSTVDLRELSDMEDYYQPHSPGALLKAAFVCCDMVDQTSSSPLSEQLTARYGGGFELQSWSNLPHGSGMGTSSILAGAVLAALLTAGGKSYDLQGLIHAVLYLEQLLTTGGGWQDQIGGLKGGVHLGLSEAKLPLYVEAIDLSVRPELIQEFNKRLLLIYTGKTRLARNLLQDVVRNWYARNPNIVSTEDALVQLAQECAHAFIDGKFDKVGQCVGHYWEMKKQMAPGCESQTIARIMAAMKPYVLGMCSAGAGGGGFIYGILRDGKLRAEAVNELSKQTDILLLLTPGALAGYKNQSDLSKNRQHSYVHPRYHPQGLQVSGLEEAVVYDATIDDQGLTVTLQSGMEGAQMECS